MRDKKTRFESFSFYDRTGIEARLERMAERGWMVEKAGGLWRYRRCEPKKVKFCVTYYPRASMFDPEPTEGELAFREFCDRTGWRLAASNAQLQIFYNERLDPVPIDTDPYLELQRLHETLARFYIPYFLFEAVIALIAMWMSVGTLLSEPVRALSEPGVLFWSVGFVLLLLMTSVDLAAYYSWRRKALRAAERGEFLRTRGTGRFQRIVSCVLLLLVLYWLAGWFIEGDALARGAMGLMLVIVLPCMPATWGTVRLLKRLKVRRWIARILSVAIPTVAVTVVGSALIFMAVPFMAGNYDRAASARPDQVYYLYSGSENAPLELGDILDADTSGYVTRRSGGESLLVGRIKIVQEVIGASGQLPELEYQIVSVKAGFVRGLVRRLIVPRFVEGRMQPLALVPVDPGPWGAEEAYRVENTETGEVFDRYVLCGGGRVAEVTLPIEPDGVQMRIVGNRLLGVE